MLLSLSWLLLAPTRLLLALRRLVARLGLAVAAGAAGAAYGLWGLGVLLRRGPRGTFRKRERSRPPPGLADGTFGEHRYLRLRVGGRGGLGGSRGESGGWLEGSRGVLGGS